MKKLLIITIPIVILFLIGIGFIFINSTSNKTVNLNNSFFIVKSDDSIGNIALMLADKKIIKSKQYLILYTNLKHKNFQVKAGNYLIKPNTPIRELVLQLGSGKSDFAIVTIPEGYSFQQTAERLEKNNLVKKNEFINLKLKDLSINNLIQSSKNMVYELEGFLFPDTYYIPYSHTKEQIAQTMFENFSKVFSDVYRNRAKELGLSINEIITIASLIEKEAANDSERSKISGVIYNRLKEGMPLQIDAAVIYAITKGEKNIQRLTYNDLKVVSSYNTYLIKGLPPGPIAAPGKPSIHAALYPEVHNYLYYVAGENGHVFSKTYEEHLQNVKKYRK